MELNLRQYREGMWGKPERVPPDQAFDLARQKDPTVTDPGYVYGSRCRDRESAEGWSGLNQRQYGHPTLGFWPQDDDTVIYVMDLRPALRKLREKS